MNGRVRGAAAQKRIWQMARPFPIYRHHRHFVTARRLSNFASMRPMIDWARVAGNTGNLGMDAR